MPHLKGHDKLATTAVGSHIQSIDKETDESCDIFIIWKINSVLVRAVGQ